MKRFLILLAALALCACVALPAVTVSADGPYEGLCNYVTTSGPGVPPMPSPPVKYEGPIYGVPPMPSPPQKYEGPRYGVPPMRNPPVKYEGQYYGFPPMPSLPVTYLASGLSAPAMWSPACLHFSMGIGFHGFLNVP